MNHSPNVLAFIGAALFFAAPSNAACPVPFNSFDCNNGAGAVDVCTQVDSATLSCALDTNIGSATPVDAWGNFFSPSSTEFSAYGVDALGEPFCCEFTVTDGCSAASYNYVEVYGSNANDTIQLRDPGPSLELECFDAHVQGRLEDDVLVGSDSDDNDDLLLGNEGDDKLRGMAGDDTIYGGEGADTMWGLIGDDDIYGWSLYITYDDTARDLIKGGAGADHAYGGNGSDWICGGNGADYLFGGAGDDIVTGEGDTEVTIDGGTNYDTCEYDNDVNCEYWPDDIFCPW